MVSFKGLLNSVQTTNNFWSAFTLKLHGKEKKIRFRNGSTLVVNWTDYCTIRDFFSSKECAECRILQEGKTLHIKDNGVSLSAPTESLAYTLFNIKKLRPSGYTIIQEKDLYVVEGHGIRIISNLDTLQVVREMLTDLPYDCDCKDKIVLDVGAFHGESAVFFSMKGAKKVILYEPVKTHQWFIEQNTSSNNVNAEIHMQGIGEKDGTQTIFYEKTDFCFGLAAKGPKEMVIETRNITDVIMKSGADVAKFDCEGAEENLVNVDNDILRTIGLFIIETHGERIKKQILQKFTKAGFIVIGDLVYNNQVSVVRFRKTDDTVEKDK
jgi:FkbM family methyltransferase